MAKRWHKNTTEAFINLFEHHRCLWDINDESYRDRAQKDDALRAILGQIQDFEPDLTIKDLKIKIHTLRSQYAKELRIIDKCKAAGEYNALDYRPRLWCFDMMSFLSRDATMQNNTQGSHENMKWMPEVPIQCTTPMQDLLQRKEKITLSTFERDLRDLKEKIIIKKERRRYQWLGDQIVDTLNEIKHEALTEEAIVFIQNYLTKLRDSDRKLSNSC